MKKALVVLLLSAVCGSVFAEPKKLTDSQKLKIVEIQLRQERLTAQYVGIQQQMQKLQADYQASQAELKNATEEILREANLPAGKWFVDLQKYELSEIPEAKVAEKKPGS